MCPGARPAPAQVGGWGRGASLQCHLQTRARMWLEAFVMVVKGCGVWEWPLCFHYGAFMQNFKKISCHFSGMTLPRALPLFPMCSLRER